MFLGAEPEEEVVWPPWRPAVLPVKRHESQETKSRSLTHWKPSEACVRFQRSSCEKTWLAVLFTQLLMLKETLKFSASCHCQTSSFSRTNPCFPGNVWTLLCTLHSDWRKENCDSFETPALRISQLRWLCRRHFSSLIMWRDQRLKEAYPFINHVLN